jgi:hypothetical protein
MAAAPARTELADTYPNPSNATLRTGMGKFWDWATTLLGTDGTPATARAALGALSNGYIHLRDQKATGTDGGASTAGTQTRTLNTEVADAGGLCALAGNQITLAAGTYRVKARAPEYALGAHKLRLRNITAGSTLLAGSSAYTHTINGTQNDSALTGRITVAASQVLELQHWTQNAVSVNGLGVNAGGSGEVEVYAEIEFWKE